MHWHEGVPRMYGTATVGERGQVVIPAEARKELDISPSDKLLVFGNPSRGSLILARADIMSEHLAKAINTMTSFEEMIRNDVKE